MRKSFRSAYMKLAYQVWANYSKKFKKINSITTWGDAIRWAMAYMSKLLS